MILIEAGCPVLDMNEFDSPQERSALEFARPADKAKVAGALALALV
jgi:hypothetical protein